MSDVELDAILGDARAALRRTIEASSAQPDFAEVVSAAHRCAPDQIPASAASEAGRLAPVVDIRRSSYRGAPAVEAELDGVIADTRGAMERSASERRLSAIPDLGATRTPEPRQPVRVLPIVAAVAVAAAAALIWAGADVVRSAARSESSDVAEQAALVPSERDATGGVAVSPDPRPAPAVRARPDAEADEADEVIIEEEVKPQPTRQRPDLAQWSEEAQRRWRAGDVAGAEALLKKIAKRGGKSRYAELAYGDLFALAHKRHGGAERARLWKAYLKRFPRGRFADDARAGLCRRASGAAGAKCWNQYLQAFPTGSYRAEATAAIERSAGDTPK